MKLGIFHFELLYTVLQEMHFLYDEEQMADMVLSRISQALDAEAGTIFRAEGDALFPLASYGVPKEDLRKIEFKVGVGVVGWVAEYMQPVKVDHPDTDPRFFGRVDRTSGFKTRSIIASPIMVGNERIGVIEFLNRRSGIFAIQDLELISMIGRQVGIAMVNARVIRERDNLLSFQDAVFSNLSAGILVADSAGVISRANDRALAILGAGNRPKLAGRPVSEALDFCPSLREVLEAAQGDASPRLRQETTVTVGGVEKRIGYSITPVTDKAGKRLGAVLLFQDISKIA